MNRANTYTTARVPYARAIGIDRTKGDPYQCPELGNTCHRPGAHVAHQAPSRVGDRLHHRDGRVTDLAGSLLYRKEAL
ncbi:hypothetical protein RD110_18750 [Rhodoferax koreense]|uniref:Uncharacterized protein n=1 Tax=Rhodoferax koreensis TaxID=1842727 RepID=A0A1P8JZ17_9BURK|nr:hypothetical protein [Rhodoferax koreense]APW38994.1 hypothetical protein RD110_18750 [Rhodoferax koreense]